MAVVVRKAVVALVEDDAAALHHRALSMERVARRLSVVEFDGVEVERDADAVVPRDARVRRRAQRVEGDEAR